MSAPAGEEVGVAASARVQTVGGAPESICRAGRSLAALLMPATAPPYQLVIVDRTGGTRDIGHLESAHRA